jgi:predicted metal-dependent hydrolase
MTLFDLSDLTRPRPSPETNGEGTQHGPDATRAPDGTQPAHREVSDSAIESEPEVAIESEPEVAIESAPEVEVRVSKRRKKTSEAKWVAGRIVVSVPAHLSVESRQKTIDWLVERLLTRHQLQSGLTDEDLLARAIELSDRYLVGAHPVSVRWVTNQTARWGSCSYYAGHIRVSHRLRVVPGWVLDSVLVHEVAHLTHADHSPAFHKLAGAYPRHKEAGVFLAGYGLGLSNPAS